jgi:hypothetical protein
MRQEHEISRIVLVVTVIGYCVAMAQEVLGNFVFGTDFSKSRQLVRRLARNVEFFCPHFLYLLLVCFRAELHKPVSGFDAFSFYEPIDHMAFDRRQLCYRNRSDGGA